VTETTTKDKPGKPGPTPLRVWIAWLTLSALAWGGVAAAIVLFPSTLDWATVPLMDYFWVYRLRFEVMPVVWMTALASPALGLVALVFRRWRPAALAVIGAVAFAQFAYIGLELWLKTYPPKMPAPEGLENWNNWPSAN
jgi:hypothetical protein